MATLVHKAGTALQTGATQCPVEKTHTQSDTVSAAGELKLFYGYDGADLSAYVTDPHKELTFEALLEANCPDHEIGDVVTVGSGAGAKRYLVTQWQITEANDDVKKVSIGLRETTLEAANQNP